MPRLLQQQGAALPVLLLLLQLQQDHPHRHHPNLKQCLAQALLLLYHPLYSPQNLFQAGRVQSLLLLDRIHLRDIPVPVVRHPA